MANWYGIDGIQFHFNGLWADPTITFAGITDDSNITVEDTMWEMFNEDYPDYEGSPTGDHFSEYMRANVDYVKDLICLARGEVEYI